MRRITLPERLGWREEAERLGFGFHEMYGEPYWSDDVAFLLTLDEIETRVEDPTSALHAMCMDFAADAVRSEELLDRLLIPEGARDLVRSSWDEGDRHLYGRFDLAYDGAGPPVMLEYNADTPTGVFEAAFFQHGWLIDRVEDGSLPAGADQFNLIQESLVEAFAAIFDGPGPHPILHVACATGNDEERGTATYLMDCAVQAGLLAEMIDVEGIGVDAAGRFTDGGDRVIERCFKLYPWEDMLREPFAPHIRPGTFIEPAWKAVLSTKALLPLLWERQPGHPHLAPSYFADDARAADLLNAPGGAVSKPVHGREGENVAIRSGDRTVAATEGTREDEARVVQSRVPLFETGGRHAVLGSWVVGDRACGLGIREDEGPITRDLSRFVPHAIVPQ